jgi:hypothetical protein
MNAQSKYQSKINKNPMSIHKINLHQISIHQKILFFNEVFRASYVMTFKIYFSLPNAEIKIIIKTKTNRN